MSALALALVAVAAVGASGSLMSALNGAIGARLGVWRATHVFMIVGSLGAGACVVLLERHVFDAQLLRALPPYALLPGLINALVVTLVIRVVRQIGTLQTTASVFTGGVVVALVLDHVGAFGLPTIAVGASRAVGAAALLVAVVWLTVALRQRDRSTLPLAWPVVALALAAGALDSVAVAMNTHLAAAAGPFTATLAFLLPGALLLSVTLPRRPGTVSVRATDAIPGLWNVAALAVALVAIPVIGLHLANASRFAAAVAAGMAVDHAGSFGGVRIPVTWRRVSAATVLVSGVVLSAL